VKRLLILMLAVLGGACTRESSRVREARNEFYSALSRFDYSAIRAAVAPEYLAVDRGRFFGFDSLIADVTLLEQESLAVHYSFTDSAIRVDPPLAWILYHGRKIVTRPNFADTSFTVESATFKRDGAGWKLALLHRTPLPSGGGYFGSDTVVHHAAVAPPPATPGGGPRTPPGNAPNRPPGSANPRPGER
jgi:hypothetical protein